MKCPTCGYNSFDHLDTCKKCGSPLRGDPRMRPVIESGTEDEYEPWPRTRPEDTTGKDFQSDEFLDIPINEGGSPSGPETDERHSGARRRKPRKQLDLFQESEAASGVSNESVREEPDPIEEGSPEDWLRSDKGGPDKYAGKYKDSYGEEEGDTEPGAAYRGLEADEVYSLAGFFPRATAFIIDLVIVAVIAYATLQLSFMVAGGGGTRGMNYIYPVLFLLASTYFIFLHALGGKTIGKMLMGIRLISDEGRDVGIWNAFLRWFGYFISAAVMMAGFFWAIFDSGGQTWHDKIAGTYVVKD